MDRRSFLKAAGTLAAAAGLAGEESWAAAGSIPKRRFGARGPMLSVIGFGGIIVSGVTPEEARRYVVEAFDRGINYFDVAPTYGNAEERLGPALAGLRDRVFLACKTEQRDRAGAAEALRRSRELLRTDHFDLYQLHGLATMEDLDRCTAAGGALEEVIAARKAGVVRYIGFSAHSAEVALAAMERFDFDSVLFPFNFVTWVRAGFGPQVLAQAQKKGLARLALKAMAYRPWPQGADRPYDKCWYQPIDDPDLASRAVRWTLSQPITAAIPPGDVRLFRLALDIAANLRPITREEEIELRKLALSTEPIFRLGA